MITSFGGKLNDCSHRADRGSAAISRIIVSAQHHFFAIIPPPLSVFHHSTDAALPQGFLPDNNRREHIPTACTKPLSPDRERGSGSEASCGYCSPPLLQQRDCHAVAEELDQRAHEEGGDDGADAGNGRDLRHPAAGQEEEADAQQHAHQIAGNADVLERPQLPFTRQDDSHRIIGGNTQVGRHIQGGAEADDHDARQQAQRPDEDRRGRQPGLQQRIGELGDIPQQEQVDEGSNADIAAVSDQAEHQQHQIDQHIQRAERDGDQAVQAAHQGLERINAKCGKLENPNADSTDENAGQRHQNSSCFHKRFCLSVLADSLPQF